MSAVTTAKTTMNDLATVKKALVLLGFKEEHIEVHKTAVPLNTYHSSDKANAHLVIRKKNLKGGSTWNDIGFEQLADGTVTAHVGDYNQKTGGRHAHLSGTWLKDLNQRYAQVKVMEELELNGYFIDSIKEVDGAIQIEAETQFA
jgi:hypothetical protein